MRRNICHQTIDRDKGRKGRNQVDILWCMFVKAMVIITVVPSWNNYI